mmetsp:Transcript_21323/g.54447  ORF Transcript_21323/g.54447 Transcript_21323/m.54447 type:complete len:237 (-) Transcript_21323:1299-2009(-)
MQSRAQPKTQAEDLRTHGHTAHGRPLPPFTPNTAAKKATCISLPRIASCYIALTPAESTCTRCCKPLTWATCCARCSSTKLQAARNRSNPSSTCLRFGLGCRASNSSDATAASSSDSRSKNANCSSALSTSASVITESVPGPHQASCAAVTARSLAFCTRWLKPRRGSVASLLPTESVKSCSCPATCSWAACSCSDCPGAARASATTCASTLSRSSCATRCAYSALLYSSNCACIW